MDLQEIRVSIDKDGKVQVEVNGVKGMGCTDITKALEEALGGEVEREMTSEAYESVDQNMDNRDWLQNG